ncbi:MAG: hypothetical protein ACR2RB_18200 [Gammaproteobacteria bacterium]
MLTTTLRVMSLTFVTSVKDASSPVFDVVKSRHLPCPEMLKVPHGQHPEGGGEHSEPHLQSFVLLFLLSPIYDS